MTTRYIKADDWLTDPCHDPTGRHDTNVTYTSIFNGNRATVDRTEYMTCKHCGAVIWGYHIIKEQDIP